MEDVPILLSAICVMVLLDRAPLSASPTCDQTKSSDVSEGNIGESQHFPWLGVLRVHIHHGDSIKIALTGLILVKERYAIANSDDIARIPRMVLKKDSKAMFIPKKGEPWYCGVKNYMMHPEYEYEKYNTIALVELDLENWEKAPFSPICWPQYFNNTSNQVYAVGYTDDNKLLEKVLYKVQYVKPSLCKEFYHKAGLSDPKSTPEHILCGVAENNKKDCQWENGMALASNSTGNWTLLGFSLRGPGCGTPARFLDMFVYLPWVESATEVVEMKDLELRRRHFSPDRRQGEDIEVKDVPLHGFYAKYDVDIDKFRPFVINRTDKDAIMIEKFDNMYEKTEGACSSYKNLAYRDKLRIVEKTMKRGEAHFRISIHDMNMAGITCIKLKIKSVRRDEATLWYRYEIDQDDWFAHEGGPQTPEDLFKLYTIHKRVPIPPRGYAFDPDSVWKPGPHMEPMFIKDRKTYDDFYNMNILVGFVFKHEATMELEVYGLQIPHWFPKSTTTEGPDKTTLKNNYENHYPPQPDYPHPEKDDPEGPKTEPVRILRRKYRPKQHRYRYNNSYVSNRRYGSYNIHRRLGLNKTQIDSEEISKIRKTHSRNHPENPRIFNKPSQKKLRRLHHGYQSGFQSPQDEYRRQKAKLRQAERMAKGN